MSEATHYLEIATEVLHTESKALLDSIQRLDSQALYEIVRTIAESRGKLVVMGVGKSGHIGAKIAATLSSTGTPSFFLHPTEAMHGDLGMIGKKDIAVLISNSGNTQEVVQDVEPLRRKGVPTVAFTAGKDSHLSKSCDYAIFYPKLPEADALNLAPTVSSTLALVLGDAIACELSARKGFSRGDFYKNHPNGALGAMLSGEKN